MIHQSWFFVSMCVGVIVGAIVAIPFRLEFFASLMWAVLAIILFLVACLKPMKLFLILAFMAGLLLVFSRVGNIPVGEKPVDTSTNFVINARDWFAERIRGLVPAPESKLGQSYLLGMKSGLPDSLSENLRVVGLTHIVVASGAHLSILVEIARKIFGKISRFAGLMFSLLFILFFMAMVGWTPSIMRAGIMAILTIMAWYVGRRIAPLRMIIIVMAATLLINPGFLTNVGWMLSFASYAGIMLIGPGLTKYFFGDKKPGFVGSSVIVTISATIMTLPVTLYYFGAVSLISVIANLLILPTLSYAMGLTFLVGVVAGISGVETVVAWCATKLLDFHILVINFFGEMKQFLVQIPPNQLWVFLIYILIFAPLIWQWWKKRKRNKSYAIMRA